MRSRFIAKLITALATLSLVLAMRGSVVSASAQNPHVTFTDQTSTVVANTTDQTPFSLGLALTGGSPSSTTVSTQLFSRLTTRSGLNAALQGQGLNNELDQSSPLAFSCLPASPGGGQQLTIDVITSSTTAPTIPGGCTDSTRPPSFNLRCTIGSGSCNGVYPVAVTVSQGTNQIARFITLMTYVERPAATPLKVAVVLRLGTTQSAQKVSAITVTDHVLHQYPTVAADVSIEPTFVQTLRTSATGRAALAQFAQTMTSTSTVHEMPKTPYVQIDPGTLLASGLQNDISNQVKRGQQIATESGFPEGSLTAGWIATAPVTSTTTSALATAGITRVLVPDSSLAQPTSTSLTWGQPFALSPGSTSVTALAADATLSAQMLPSSQPVLAAERFLGDLAFLHFERPSLTLAQGVVAESPSGFQPNEEFLNTVFAGMSTSPVFAPNTLSGLFAELSIGANGAPTTRQLANTGSSQAWPAAQISGFTSQRERQAAFADAVVDDQGMLETLTDAAYRVESDHLTTAKRSAAIATTASGLDAQLAKFNISSGDITLTALNGTLPITLTSTASYTLHGVLQVASPQLRFPHGAQTNQTIDRSTESVRIAAQAVTSGDFPLTATLVTPQGSLQIATQRITVRATQSSIVGVILTIGALLVLLLWWLKTWRTKTATSRRVL